MTQAEEQKAFVLDKVREADAAVRMYNLTFGKDAPLVGFDFVIEEIPPADDPVLEIREDGAALLRDYVQAIEEAAADEDPDMREWAKFASPYGMLVEIGKREGLTDRQRTNILASCGRANFWVGGRPTGESDRDYAGRTFLGFEYVNGQPHTSIDDCHAFQSPQSNGFTGGVLRDIPRYAKLHIAEWKAGRRGMVFKKGVAPPK